MIGRDRVSTTWHCYTQYLGTAVVGLCQYPANGIPETSNNNFVSFARNLNVILLVDRCENGGVLIPVTNNLESVRWRRAMHLYPQIENVIPSNEIPSLPCFLRRPQRIAYGKLDVVLFREPEFTLRLSAKFDV